MTSATEFYVPESVVCERMGITPSEVRELRGAEGGFWKKGANGRILWSVEGMAEFASRWALSASESTVVVQAHSEKKTLVVARVRTARSLHVVPDGAVYDARNPVWLWLPQPKGALFARGMKVAGIQRPENPTIYDFAGNPDRPEKGRRFPRSFGKW